MPDLEGVAAAPPCEHDLHVLDERHGFPAPFGIVVMKHPENVLGIALKPIEDVRLQEPRAGDFL